MDEDQNALGKLLGMIVHDLRNPGATIGANVSYVREVLQSHPDDDVREALEDVDRALGDLMLGLEQMAWIGRWLSSEAPVALQDGDVAPAIRGLRSPPRELEVELDLAEEPLVVRGGGKALTKLVTMFVENSAQHARRGTIAIASRREGGDVVIEIEDGGAPLDPTLYEEAFTLQGQLSIKGRAKGRYGRVAGLLSAKILADAIGASIEPGERDGRAKILLRMPLVRQG